MRIKKSSFFSESLLSSCLRCDIRYTIKRKETKKMKEKLIEIWEREEKNLPLIKELKDRKAIFNLCFGALLLAVEVDRSLEYELAKLWTEEWKERLEKQVYGNED